MISDEPHFLLTLLELLTGGFLGLMAASLACQFGWRSADRLPGESRRPNCVYCLRPLTKFEMAPLMGWLMRKRPLAFPCPCGERKGLWAQPAAELTGFVLGLAGMYLAGLSWMALPLCLALGLLPAIAVIDLHFGIIPDEHNVLIALLGIWWVWASGNDVFVALIIGAALLAIGLFGAITYSRWRGKDMLGLGDVKFFAAAGLWLEPEHAPWFLALSGFLGAVVGIVWQRVSGNKESPFAPALCISLAVFILYRLAQVQY